MCPAACMSATSAELLMALRECMRGLRACGIGPASSTGATCVWCSRGLVGWELSYHSRVPERGIQVERRFATRCQDGPGFEYFNTWLKDYWLFVCFFSIITKLLQLGKEGLSCLGFLLRLRRTWGCSLSQTRQDSKSGKDGLNIASLQLPLKNTQTKA